MEFANESCAADNTFGPFVNKSCRGGYDFTILFEEAVFCLIPVLILFLGLPFRLKSLFSRTRRVKVTKFHYAKLIAIGVLVILKFALLMLWIFGKLPYKTLLTVTTALLSFCEAIIFAWLSYAEDVYSPRPSTLLSLYLVVSLIFDCVRSRSLWLRHDDISLDTLFTLATATKAIVLILESKRKRSRLFEKELSEEESGGVLDRSVFLWVVPLITNGYRRIVSLSDSMIFSIDSNLVQSREQQIFEKYVSEHPKTTVWGLLKNIWVLMWWDIISPILPKLLYVSVSFAQPFMIKAMLQFLGQGHNVNVNTGYVLLGCYALVYFALAVFNAVYGHEVDRLQTKVRGHLIYTIYKKTLTSNISKVEGDASLTLMSTDVERILLSVKYLHELWASILVVVVALALLYRELHIAFLSPLVWNLICTYLVGQLSGIMVRRHRAWLESTQKRVSYTASIISSYKWIKMLGLGPLLEEKVAELRAQEVRLGVRVRRILALILSLSVFASDGSLWSTLVLFTLINGVNNRTLTVERLFSSLSILNLFLTPMETLLQSSAFHAAAFAALGRINNFLNTVDQRDSPLIKTTDDNLSEHVEGIELQAQNKFTSNDLIEIKDGEFGWDINKPILFNIDLDVRRGSFCLIIGPTGSGKSTLLNAILGECFSTGGFVNMHTDSVAYCSQTPWILNTTIRYNIMGQSNFDLSWYQKVIAVCALNDDINRMAQGDQTMAGSGGIILSGGQKQRIALARAVYSKKQVLILDDVLSGLDALTEEHVFSQVMGSSGLLKSQGITVVMATHAVYRGAVADHVVVLDATGKISEQGTFSTLSISHLAREAKSTDTESPTQVVSEGPTTEPAPVIDDSGRADGDWSVYSYFCRTIKLKHLVIFAVLGCVDATLLLYQPLWLNQWASHHPDKSPKFFLGIYTVLVFIHLGSGFVWLWHAFEYPLAQASVELHNLQLRTLMRLKMSSFTGTDNGVLTNRFSQDMMLIDNELPQAGINTAASLLQAVGQIIILLVTSYYMAAVMPFLAIILWCLQRIYLRTSRQLRFLDLEAKSPLYSHFMETLTGLSTIRAFSWQAAFEKQNGEALKKSQVAFYYLATIQRWLILVLDLIIAVLAVVLVGIAIALREKIQVGLLGVALTNIMTLNITLRFLILFWTNLETSIGAVSRVRAFIQDSEEESFTHSIDGPLYGNLKFENIEARYGNNTVLHQVSLSISAKQKVGICGSSGSGKSTFLSTLLGLMEYTGKISIDGIDTKGASNLREILSVLPQESFLLDASVKENLGLFGATTEEMKQALEKVELWSKFEDKDGLDTTNFAELLSAGEKQLFCLARVMLKESSILLLDEVTSSVDSGTEMKMQRIISEHFKDYTVIAVAHHLNTIIDYDRVLVLEKGKIVEDGKPSDLLSDSASAFSRLYIASST